MGFIAEADDPDPRKVERAKRSPRKYTHGDRIKRKIKIGASVPYTWLVLKIESITPDGKWAWCQIQIDNKGCKSLK